MAKGNKCINKSIAKEIEFGKIIQDIPEIEHNGEMYPLFTVISNVSVIHSNFPNTMFHMWKSIKIK
jgi:hypothetical protein